MFRQKDPKPLAPGRGPPGSFAPVPTVRAAELASLRQSSPPNRFRDWGAALARRRRELAAATTARFLAKLGMTEREGRMTEGKGAAATTVFPFKKNAWDFLLKSQPPLLHHIPF